MPTKTKHKSTSGAYYIPSRPKKRTRPRGWIRFEDLPRSPKAEAVRADILARLQQHFDEDTLPRGANGLFYDLRPYDFDTHRANPFANGASETERAKFAKEHPDLAERCKDESRPVAFPIGKAFNLTAQSRISRIPRLKALFDGMATHETQWRKAEIAALEKAKIEAQAKLEALQEETRRKTEPIRVGAPIA